MFSLSHREVVLVQFSDNLSSGETGDCEAGHPDGEDFEFLEGRDTDATRKNVVFCAPNPFKQAAIDLYQYPHGGAAFGVNEGKQFECRSVVGFGAAADVGEECTFVLSWRGACAAVQQ